MYIHTVYVCVCELLHVCKRSPHHEHEFTNTAWVSEACFSAGINLVSLLGSWESNGKTTVSHPIGCERSVRCSDSSLRPGNTLAAHLSFLSSVHFSPFASLLILQLLFNVSVFLMYFKCVSCLNLFDFLMGRTISSHSKILYQHYYEGQSKCCPDWDTSK